MELQQISYSEYIPPSRLQPFLYCYWSFHSKSDIKLLDVNPIIPDGCVDIIFDLTLPTQSKCFLVGPMTKPIINKKNKLFGIRFKPGMATTLLNVPLNELTDQIVDIKNVKNYGTDVIADKLAYENNQQHRELLVNSIFCKLLVSPLQFEEPLETAIMMIQKSTGLASIQEVTKKTGWSRQHFARKFLQRTGLTPKFYSQVVRVNNVIEQYKYRKKYGFGDLAQVCGYFDQSHMNNEFKKITGKTPQVFMNNH